MANLFEALRVLSNLCAHFVSKGSLYRKWRPFKVNTLSSCDSLPIDSTVVVEIAPLFLFYPTLTNEALPSNDSQFKAAP